VKWIWPAYQRYVWFLFSVCIAVNSLDVQELREFSRAEVAEHNTYESQWLIVNDKVYDITKFAKRHPGGKVISFYRGRCRIRCDVEYANGVKD
jgi:cytochrome b involved in lipid metabolism